MKIVFRVDASNKIGTGHFMRCLTLAEGLYKHGASIKFISRHITVHFIDMLKIKGCHFLQLPNIEGAKVDSDLLHADWLGVGQLEDALATKNALLTEKCDWLIVDHYALDSRWEKTLRPVTKKIMAIDDIADREHDCDLLLDQNYYHDMQSRYNGKVPDYCKLMFGPKYALLRDEFLEIRSKTKPRNGRVKQVLVFFGGIDQGNFTGKVIQALSSITGVAFDVDVVIGIQHPAKNEIESDCKRYGYTCHVQTIEMAKLIANADLGIGAGGSATWERCALGLPAIVLSVAENQHEIAKSLSEVSAILFLGRSTEFTVEKLKNLIMDVCETPEKLKTMSEVSFGLVDGKGVERLIRHLYENYSSLH